MTSNFNIIRELCRDEQFYQDWSQLQGPDQRRVWDRLWDIVAKRPDDTFLQGLRDYYLEHNTLTHRQWFYLIRALSRSTVRGLQPPPARPGYYGSISLEEFGI